MRSAADLTTSDLTTGRQVGAGSGGRRVHERGDDPTAGLSMLEGLRKSHPDLPVIFYVGEVDRARGVPPFAFGLTNLPNELLHLIPLLERLQYVTDVRALLALRQGMPSSA